MSFDKCFTTFFSDWLFCQALKQWKENMANICQSLIYLKNILAKSLQNQENWALYLRERI